MELRKTNVLDNEPIGEYLQGRVVRKYNKKVSVDIINNLLEKYFEEVVDHVLENGTFTYRNMSVGIHKVETVLVEKKLRQYYIIPAYGSAYSYTIRISFKDKLKGVYFLKPERKLLKKLEDRLNTSPDFKIRIYAKKTA
jgi:hypothetical protein